MFPDERNVGKYKHSFSKQISVDTNNNPERYFSSFQIKWLRKSPIKIIVFFFFAPVKLRNQYCISHGLQDSHSDNGKCGALHKLLSSIPTYYKSLWTKIISSIYFFNKTPTRVPHTIEGRKMKFHLKQNLNLPQY